MQQAGEPLNPPDLLNDPPTLRFLYTNVHYIVTPNLDLTRKLQLNRPEHENKRITPFFALLTRKNFFAVMNPWRTVSYLLSVSCLCSAHTDAMPSCQD